MAAKVVKEAAKETKTTLAALTKMKDYMAQEHIATSKAVDKAFAKVTEEEEVGEKDSAEAADVADKEAEAANASIPEPVVVPEEPLGPDAEAGAAVKTLARAANTTVNASAAAALFESARIALRPIRPAA